MSSLQDGQPHLQIEASLRASQSHYNDPVLIQRCLQGDQAAWSQLVEKYSRLVYSIPRRYGLSQEDAEDVFQNVFVIVLRELKKLRQQDRISAWLITITHREALRLMRRQARPASTDVLSQLPTLEETIQEFEQQEVLRQALDMLEPRERAVTMAALSDAPLTFDELADKLNLPRGSIGFYRKRGLEHLRENLKKLGYTGEE
jgi:RNA polymerase sigma factor (sigma-70 family)